MAKYDVKNGQNIKKSIIQSIQSIEKSRSRAIKPSRIQEDKDSKSQGIKKSGLTLSQVRQDVTVLNFLVELCGENVS